MGCQVMVPNLHPSAALLSSAHFVIPPSKKSNWKKSQSMYRWETKTHPTRDSYWEKTKSNHDSNIQWDDSTRKYSRMPCTKLVVSSRETRNASCSSKRKSRTSITWVSLHSQRPGTDTQQIQPGEGGVRKIVGTNRSKSTSNWTGKWEWLQFVHFQMRARELEDLVRSEIMNPFLLSLRDQRPEYIFLP